jgi:hypothetical protein
LLNQDGYTIRGVQQLLQSGVAETPEAGRATEAAPPQAANESGALPIETLRAIRQTLVEALEAAAV